ncbi:hypothetical protein [Epilithonimonas sp.]|uniref:hypothetical protein n=1 Tax=Epilithonimonas sp. TaxID=2894511 RepID=UPI0028A28FB7|nr:hypothetical protein [Epilithonimonas sp.]
MKNRQKGINAILMLSVLYCSVGMAFAQIGPTGIGTRNPQGPLHIDGAKDNDATAPTLPTSAQAANDVIVDKTTGFIGVGTLTPKVALDIRSSDTQNALGLGTTTMTAAAAAEGAIRYDEINLPVGAKIEYSDGVVWNKLFVAQQKAVVVAHKVTPLDIANTATKITDWFKDRDMTSSFNAATGEFTAPHDGTYTFLLTFNLKSATINDGTLVESQFYRISPSNLLLARVYKTFGQSMTGTSDDANVLKPTQAGGSSTATFVLAAGDIVTVRMLHNLTGNSIGLRVTGNPSDPANPDDGFNNLTIIEH